VSSYHFAALVVERPFLEQGLFMTLPRRVLDWTVEQYLKLSPTRW
jgi:hypothetical protein